MPQGQGKRLSLKFSCASYLPSNMLPNYLRPDYLQLDAKSCRNKAASVSFPLTAITTAFSCPKVPIPTRQGGYQRVKRSSASAVGPPERCRERTLSALLGWRQQEPSPDTGGLILCWAARGLSCFMDLNGTSVRKLGKRGQDPPVTCLVWIPAAPAETERRLLQTWLFRTCVIIYARRLMKGKLKGADF